MAGGGWPGTFDDVAAGIGALALLSGQYPLDTTRVTVIGHSAGGQLALWSAAQRPVGHVLSLAGVCDLVSAANLGLSDGAAVELLGGGPRDIPGVYAQACPKLLLPLGTRQTVVHGTADRDVPFSLSRGYAEAAARAGDPCAFMPLPGAGHFDLIDPTTPAWEAVAGHLS